MKKSPILHPVYSILLFCASFLLCRWVYMTYLYSFGINILGHADSGNDFIRPLIAILSLSLMLYMVLDFILTKRLNLFLLKILMLCYFCFLFYVLFLKSIGVQGWNSDIRQYFHDMLTVDPLAPLFNIALFMPLGLCFKLNLKNIGLFLLFISSCESIQYLCHLGFFDVGDILFNTLGFSLGAGLRKITMPIIKKVS